LSDSILKLEFSPHIFEKPSSVKFHKNPSSGSRVLACGQRERRRDGQTDMKKHVFSFRNFTNALNPYPANVENRVSS